ncbi:MAG: FAD-dependent monooxygenase, partial [Gemmatimonadetes bacterium]|nr:FAD-dependent monooxygenase [Gemmatimonadota bacterium]
MCLGQGLGGSSLDDGASDGAEIITSRARTVETDVCIVGAGPVGLVLADTLSGRGVHVTLLERGTGSGPLDVPEPDPDLDAALDAPGWNPLWQSRCAGTGGTVRMWNNYVDNEASAKLLPFEPIDFEARPGLPLTGWPFGFDHLRRYLDGAAEVCGLPADAWGDAGARGLDSTGTPGPWAPPLQLRWYAFGGQSPFLDSVPARLRARPHVRWLRGAAVVAFDTADHGARVTAVRWTGTAPGEVRTSALVLAAGTIENARLLLATADGAAWGDSEWLGRGLMEHPIDRSMHLITRSPLLTPDLGVFGPHRWGSSRGDAEGAAVWRMARLGIAADELRAESLPNASLRVREPRGRAEAAAQAVLEAPTARSWGRRLVPSVRARRLIGDTVRGAARGVRRFRATTLPLLVDLEQWPHPDNRVVLEPPTGPDVLPKARVRWRWTAEDDARRELLVDRFVDAVRA